MWLYNFLDRFFPNSFHAKVSFAALVGAQIPMLSAVGIVLKAQLGVSMISALLVASVMGAVLTSISVLALLAPVRRLKIALALFESAGVPPDLPINSKDDLGRLTAAAGRMAQTVLTLDRIASAAEVDPLTGALNRQRLKESTHVRCKRSAI